MELEKDILEKLQEKLMRENQEKKLWQINNKFINNFYYLLK